MEIVVPARIEKVFEQFTNFGTIARFLPKYYTLIKIRSSRENITVIEEHLSLGDYTLVMMTKHTVQSPNLHEISVIGGDCKGSHIIQRFEAVQSGTKVTVEGQLQLRTVFGLKNIFANKKIQNDYFKMIGDLAKVIED